MRGLILKRLKKKILAIQFSREISLFRFLSREAALAVASKINVTDEPSERLASLAKHHPYAIPKLSLNQLDQILLREEVIHAMDPRCVN